MSTNEIRPTEEEGRITQESRGTSTGGSLLSLVVGIQRRGPVDRQPGPSIGITTSLRGGCVTAAQQTSTQERQPVCGSFEVNLSEQVLARTITLENIESRAEARIELVDPGLPDRPPPSYTSVESPDRPAQSYRHPPPPPSYEQALGIRYLDRELPFIGVTDPTRIWGYRSQPAYCSRCNAMVLTSLELEFCYVTHLTAAILFVGLCWPCIVCPYFLPMFKEVHHFCPACNTFLGCYRPIPSRPHRTAQGHR